MKPTEDNLALAPIAGVILLLWAVHDISKGRTSDNYCYARREHPANFWTSVVARLLLAIACFAVAVFKR